MNRSLVRAATAVLLLGAAAACSPAPAPPSPNPTAPTPASSSATPPPSPKPTDDGRDFASCLDGHCQVHVTSGDKIQLDGVLGVQTITFVAITQDGGGAITHPNPTQEGMFDEGNRSRLTFPEVTYNNAVVRIDA
ncbi:hypothetical protein OG943_07920 [Amycolatopsis sp. NBC_00345]|uniref:hypothetical protein n=1 Tax=Amycolatopsis sp. NBC_00345 TaxID=2975955 RepID=UPI002E26ECFB